MAISCSIDELLTDISAPQDGFVVNTTLREHGVSRRRAQSCRDRGRLHHIVGNVSHVSLRRDQLSARQWIRARWLAAGPGAALSRLAALEVGGGTRFDCHGHLDILVPSKRRIVLPNTTLHVAADLHPDDLETADGMLITNAPRTVAELGRDFTGAIGWYQIAHAIHRLEYRDRTTTYADAIEVELDRRRYLGSPQVRAALQLYRSNSIGTRSRTEDRYVEMALASAPTVPLVNTVHAVLDRTLEIDLMFLPELVRVEIKGGQHGRIHDEAVDHVRDMDGSSAGITTIDEDWRTVWRDLPGCRNRLLTALKR